MDGTLIKLIMLALHTFLLAGQVKEKIIPVKNLIGFILEIQEMIPFSFLFIQIN